MIVVDLCLRYYNLTFGKFTIGIESVSFIVLGDDAVSLLLIESMFYTVGFSSSFPPFTSSSSKYSSFLNSFT